MAVKGRPRGFDVDDALDKAIDVFWRQGYEGTTLDDLTTAMGINKPSLYAAFGNKTSTFKRAIERYTEVDMAYARDALDEPTARAVAEHYLRSNVAAITAPDRPAGCLSIQGGLSASAEDIDVVRFLTASRIAGTQRLEERFQRAIDEGDLAASESAADLASYIATVSSGLAVQAAAGITRPVLMRVVERALAAFPS